MLGKKKHTKDKYKAVIIGAGRIGAGFDAPESTAVLTHAHAFKIHPAVELAGICDINFKKAQQAAAKWSCVAFHSLDQMMRQIKPALVSICTPDPDHARVLRLVYKYKPQMVFCEKPAVSKVKDLVPIVALYDKLKIPVSVNYSRRFDSVIRLLRNNIIKKKYGRIISASGIYTKGIIHNGSHLVDLARFLFGEIKSLTPLSRVNDYMARDMSVAAFLQFDRCDQFHLMTGDDRCYGIFELDILCERQRIRLIDFGFNLSRQKINEDLLYKGFYSLAKPVIKKTNLNQAMVGLVNNAVNYLEKEESLFCDLRDALQTQQICESLLKRIKKICPN